MHVCVHAASHSALAVNCRKARCMKRAGTIVADSVLIGHATQKGCMGSVVGLSQIVCWKGNGVHKAGEHTSDSTTAG